MRKLIFTALAVLACKVSFGSAAYITITFIDELLPVETPAVWFYQREYEWPVIDNPNVIAVVRGAGGYSAHSYYCVVERQPTPDEYEFLGWFEEGATEPYQFTEYDYFFEDRTFYARYRKFEGTYTITVPPMPEHITSYTVYYYRDVPVSEKVIVEGKDGVFEIPCGRTAQVACQFERFYSFGDGSTTMSFYSKEPKNFDLVFNEPRLEWQFLVDYYDTARKKYVARKPVVDRDGYTDDGRPTKWTILHCMFEGVLVDPDFMPEKGVYYVSRIERTPSYYSTPKSYANYPYNFTFDGYDYSFVPDEPGQKPHMDINGTHLVCEYAPYYHPKYINDGNRCPVFKLHLTKCDPPDWPVDPESEIGENTSAADLGLTVEALQGATRPLLTRICKWARANKVRRTAFNEQAAFDAMLRPTTDMAMAYLLDCENTADAIAAKRNLFRFDTILPGTVPMIGNGMFGNGFVRVDAYDDPACTIPASKGSGHVFYRATLQTLKPPQNDK